MKTVTVDQLIDYLRELCDDIEEEPEDVEVRIAIKDSNGDRLEFIPGTIRSVQIEDEDPETGESIKLQLVYLPEGEALGTIGKAGREALGW